MTPEFKKEWHSFSVAPLLTGAANLDAYLTDFVWFFFINFNKFNIYLCCYETENTYVVYRYVQHIITSLA